MKKAIIILTIVLIVLATILFVKTRSGQKPDTFPTSDVPTPGDAERTSQNGLYIVSTSPINNSHDVTPSQSIIVTFSRPFIQSEVTIAINPAVQFDTVIEKNDLIITPKNQLSFDTKYSYTILYTASKNKKTLAFNTVKSSESIQAESDSQNTYSEDQKYELEHNPDIFLVNNTPYDSTSFSLTSSYVEQPTGHYTFILTLKGTDKEKAKQDALNWLLSLGLTEAQIQSLDILNR